MRRTGRFGQATPEKLAECLAQGMCLDLASGTCKPLGQCFDGYTPPGTLPPVDIPPTGGGGGGTTQLPTGHTVVIATAELDKLKSASDSRLFIGLGAGAGGLLVGALVGWAASR